MCMEVLAAAANACTFNPAAQVCALLDLDPLEAERPEFALIMAGAAPLPGG